MIAGGASRDEPPILEAQQALLLQALRRAGGEPVSYAELRDAGVELPASIVAELELAGVPIERCHGGAHGGRRVLGVRLRESVAAAEAEPGPERSTGQSESEPEPRAAQSNPGPEPEPVPRAAAEVSSEGWTPVRIYRTAPGRALADHTLSSLAAAGGLAARGTRALHARDTRLIAAVGVGTAIVVVAVLVLTTLSRGATHTSAPRTVARKPTRTQLTQVAPSAPERTRRTSTAAAPPTPISPALATNLESQGHALLASSQYASAIPVLRRALAATGEQANACLQPNSTTCLTYAYALYDLGRALRLSGHSAAAVPLLEARLQIDNQRPAVAAELQLAREHVG